MDTLNPKSYRLVILLLLFAVYIIPTATSQCTFLRILEENPTCDLANGVLTIVMDGTAGPYQYSIDNGAIYQSSNIFTGLPAGDYLVRVIDANGCVTVLSPQLANNGFPEYTIDIDNCVNSSAFSDVTLTIVSGRDPFTYAWAGPNGYTSDQISLIGVESGDYFLTLTDGGGCEVDTMITVDPCCRLEINCPLDLIDLACPTDLPALPPSFLDTDPEGDGDKIAIVDYLGVSFGSIPTCGDVLVQAQESKNTGSGCGTDTLKITRTFTISDDNLSFDCVQIFNIVDDVDPDLVDPAKDMQMKCSDLTVDVQQEFDQWLASRASATATDCNAISWSTIPATPTLDNVCGQGGTSTVRFVCTDDCGNTTETEATFTVTDDVAPVFESSPVDGTYQCGDTPNWIAPIVSDDCATVDLDFNDDEDQNNCEGIIYTRTWIATDECGNVSTATQSFQPAGFQPIEINCPAELVLECDDPTNDQQIADWIASVASPTVSCSPITDINSYDPNDIVAVCGNEYTIDFMRANDCGNEVNCNAKIRFIDSVDPVITCPTDLIITIGDPTAQDQVDAWLAAASGSDNCSASIGVTNTYDPLNFSYECGPAGANTIFFNSQDDCGNTTECSANIILEGAATSTINCPTPLILECDDPNKDQLINDWLSTATGADSDGAPLTVSNDFNTADFVSCVTTISVEFSAPDPCGVDIRCIGEIILEDNTAPAINCGLQVLTLSSNGVDNESLVNDWLSSVTTVDACSNAAVTNNYDPNSIDIDCGEAATVLVMFTATDECGNFTTCQGAIDIKSTPSLQIVCPADLNLECNDPANDAMIASWLTEASAQDDAGNAAIVTNDFVALINDGCTTQIPVTFEALDECQTPVTCQGFINISDTTQPDISCVNELVMNIEDYDQATIADWLDQVTASDNCSAIVGVGNNFDPTVAFELCNDAMPVEFTAADECGNVSSCVANIRVVDNENPILLCPGNLTLKCTDANLEGQILDHLSQIDALDNGEVRETTHDFDISMLEDISCGQTSTFSIDVEAYDVCGNGDGCTIEIRVETDLQVYIPNVFSPNDDGVNDRFIPYGNEYADEIVEMMIYNRWGELVFSQSDLELGDESAGWDGRYNLSDINPGVYTYYVLVMDGDQKEHKFAGDVTVTK